jgi:hypothetical protein
LKTEEKLSVEPINVKFNINALLAADLLFSKNQTAGQTVSPLFFFFLVLYTVTIIDRYISLA